jgi:hypothetical protein
LSHYDYQVSIRIELKQYPFYAVLMAAMRQADTENLRRLRLMFPDTWDELKARIHAPAGLLPGDDEFKTIDFVKPDEVEDHGCDALRYLLEPQEGS